MNLPPSYHIILLILNQQEVFEGKTNLQKSVYLLNQMQGLKGKLPFRFKPYFYGPYCEQISDCLVMLEANRFILIKENPLLIESPFEAKKTIFSVENLGKKKIQELEKSYSEFCKKLSESYSKIKDTGFDKDTKILSVASKVLFILSSQGTSLATSQITNLAKDLNWNLQPQEIKKAATFLERLGLAKQVQRSQ